MLQTQSLLCIVRSDNPSRKGSFVFLQSLCQEVAPPVSSFVAKCGAITHSRIKEQHAYKFHFNWCSLKLNLVFIISTFIRDLGEVSFCIHYFTIRLLYSFTQTLFFVPVATRARTEMNISTQWATLYLQGLRFLFGSLL